MAFSGNASLGALSAWRCSECYCRLVDDEIVQRLSRDCQSLEVTLHSIDSDFRIQPLPGKTRVPGIITLQAPYHIPQPYHSHTTAKRYHKFVTAHQLHQVQSSCLLLADSLPSYKFHIRRHGSSPSSTHFLRHWIIWSNRLSCTHLRPLNYHDTRYNSLWPHGENRALFRQDDYVPAKQVSTPRLCPSTFLNLSLT